LFHSLGILEIYSKNSKEITWCIQFINSKLAIAKKGKSAKETPSTSPVKIASIVFAKTIEM
jgi:hypothetical protein